MQLGFWSAIGTYSDDVLYIPHIAKKGIIAITAILLTNFAIK